MSDGGLAFQQFLTSNANVNALIAGRMYPRRLPQASGGAVMPAIVYHIISHIPEHQLTGATDLTQYRIQLDLYALTRQEAHDLKEAVRNAADGYRGPMGAEFCESSELDSARSDSDPPLDGSDVYRYIEQCDYLLWFLETLPTG